MVCTNAKPRSSPVLSSSLQEASQQTAIPQSHANRFTHNYERHFKGTLEPTLATSSYSLYIEFMAFSSNFLFCCLLPPSRWWDYRGAPTCHFVCACAHVCTDAGTCTWRSEDNPGCCSLKCFCWSLTWNPPGWPTRMGCMWIHQIFKN